jgi:hypothetical protein
MILDEASEPGHPRQNTQNKFGTFNLFGVKPVDHLSLFPFSFPLSNEERPKKD